MHSERLGLERSVAALSGAGAALLGIAGLVGWGFGLPVLTRMAPGYKAIAPIVALSLIILGLVLPRLASGRAGRRERVLSGAVVGLISLFGLLEVIGFLVGADVNREDVLTLYLARASSIPFETMSPVAGALLLLVGAALLALLLGPTADRSRRKLGDTAGILGLVAATVALVFGLGYAFGAPLLYGGPAIPIAATAALGGLLLAGGTVAAAGRDHWPLRALAGDSARARLLRAFVPLTVFIALTISVADHRLAAVESLNHLLVASMLAVVFALVVGLVASRVAQAIGETIDQARREQQVAEDALREAKDHLGIRVKERTTELEQANRALQEEMAERERAEQAVKAERQRFNDALEKLPAYLVLLTPDYHVPFANRFFRERFGESHGRRCFEYLFGRSEPCEVCETYRPLETMAPHRWEWTGPDSRNYDIFDFPFTDTDGSTLVMEVGIDITDRKRAEEELRRHEEHLEALVKERTADLEARNAQLAGEIADRKRAEEALRESREDLNRAQAVARTGSWRLNVLRDELLWSDETYRMFGIPRETPMTYEAFLATVYPDDREYVDRKWTAALGGEEYDIEHRIVVGDAVKWVRERGHLEFDKGGRLLGGFGTVQDITERKRAEQERERLLQVEHARARLAETLAAEISHRTKNNLAMVVGLLQMQIDAQPGGDGDARILRDAITRIATFGAVHEQLYERRADVVELLDAMHRIADLARQALSKGDVEVSVEGERTWYPAKVATNICVVGNELLTNAIKHGAPGPDGRLRIRIGVALRDGKFRLSVWNSGNPVPRSFDPREQKAMGLRLVCDMAEREYRGTFTVRAHEGGTLAEIVMSDDRLRSEG